jgi:hypothetical protein
MSNGEPVQVFSRDRRLAEVLRESRSRAAASRVVNGEPRASQCVSSSPLPGDLVICPHPAARVAWCYAVAVWPHLERTGRAFPTYEEALLRARQHAGAKTVAVWRNHSLDSQKLALENVTTG